MCHFPALGVWEQLPTRLVFHVQKSSHGSQGWLLTHGLNEIVAAHGERPTGAFVGNGSAIKRSLA